MISVRSIFIIVFTILAAIMTVYTGVLIPSTELSHTLGKYFNKNLYYIYLGAVGAELLLTLSLFSLIFVQYFYSKSTPIGGDLFFSNNNGPIVLASFYYILKIIILFLGIAAVTLFSLAFVYIKQGVYNAEKLGASISKLLSLYDASLIAILFNALCVILCIFA